MSPSSYLLLISLPLIHSTTEWWGDLRAHMNPPRAPAFYDVTYDDSECNSGLRADAIPDYVYFGTMIATFSVAEHDECLRKCVEKPKCKSVNFFFPLASQDKSFCELLSETQHDNPRLMRPFRRAIHYENIRCKETEPSVIEEDKAVVPSSTSTTSKPSSTTTAASAAVAAAAEDKRTTARPAAKEMPTLITVVAVFDEKKTTVTPKPVSLPTLMPSTTVVEEKKTVVGIPRPGYGGSKDIPLLMKKLASKMNEFKKEQFTPFRA